MSLQKNARRGMLSWLFVAALFAFCGVLGFLQYRWIGEVSIAARERLRGSLQANLDQFSRDFNSELSGPMRALAPANSQPDAQAVEAALSVRFGQWSKVTRHNQIFSRIAIAVPQEGAVELRSLDLKSNTFQAIDWPETWSILKARLDAMIQPDLGQRRRPPGPFTEPQGLVFESPIFGNNSPGQGHGPFRRREVAWVIFEVSLPYIRDAVLPELLQRDLPDYQVEVLTKTNPPEVIYQSDPAEPEATKRISRSADARVSILDPRFDERAAGPLGMRGRGPGKGPGLDPGLSSGMDSSPGRVPGAGYWEMFVRHRAGSLEAVVAGLRWRNLAVTSGVLLLMLASVAALIRYTRRAQKLAQLQMDFVAGVSHELRTPLAVIHTAGYNLRGKMAHNPSQVERYGALIQEESGKLTSLVEQVLRFAASETGRVIQEPEPLSVESVIQDSMESSKSIIDGSHCLIEQTIEPGLPLILGDPMALKHAMQNLLSNAAKYGTKESNWIGIFACKATDKGRAMVEIRVADRGPGISEEEQEHIFDPFFRGQRAVQDQVHGTGLGLNLVKKIVEAHGGSIRVKSRPLQGAEFIVLIPEAAAGVSG